MFERDVDKSLEFKPSWAPTKYQVFYLHDLVRIGII